MSSRTASNGIGVSTILAFGSMGMPLSASILIIGMYVPRQYVGLGLSFVGVSAAISFVRLSDILFDPFVAILIDRTRTPIGRYRPWFLLGTPLLMLGVWKLLMPDAPVTVPYLTIWLIAAFAGLSILSLGIAAWGAVLVRDYHERSRTYALFQALAIAGAVAVLLLPLFTHGAVAPGKPNSMPIIAGMLLISLPLATAICTLFTPERVAPPPIQHQFSLRQFWTAISRPNMRRIILSNLFIGLGTGATAPINVFFLHDAKGFGVPDVGLLLIFYICPGLIGSPLWARVARAYGKDRTIQLACFAYAAAMAGLLALPRVHAPYPMVDAIPTAIGMFALGFTVSAFQFMFGSMVADVVDEVKLEDGHDATSLLYSMITTTSKLGSTATVLLVFPLLQLIGYDGREGATNTPHAILGLALCYGIAPTLLVLAGAGALFGYRLDAARHSEIRMALEKRDVSAAERGIDLAPATAVEPSRRAQ